MIIQPCQLLTVVLWSNSLFRLSICSIGLMANLSVILTFGGAIFKWFSCENEAISLSPSAGHGQYFFTISNCWFYDYFFLNFVVSLFLVENNNPFCICFFFCWIIDYKQFWTTQFVKEAWSSPWNTHLNDKKISDFSISRMMVEKVRKELKDLGIFRRWQQRGKPMINDVMSSKCHNFVTEVQEIINNDLCKSMHAVARE